MAHQTEPFTPSKVAVITISDTRTFATDKSGDFICQSLEQARHQLVDRKIIKDDMATIRSTVQALLDEGSSQFIICTGGTGLTQRDVTPEALEPLYTKRIPGFGELFRMLSYDDIGTSTIQSRAEAGLCGHAVVFALPGSTGACKLAMEKIILSQIDPTHKPCNFRGILPC